MKAKRIKCGRPGRYVCTLRKRKSKRFGRPVIIGGRIAAPYYGGKRRLRGRGFGSFFGSLFKKLAPVVLPAVGSLINTGIETGSKFAVQQGQKLINRGADYLRQKYGRHSNLINMGQDLFTMGANSLLKTGKNYANRYVNDTIQDLINRTQRGRGLKRLYASGWGAAPELSPNLWFPDRNRHNMTEEEFNKFNTISPNLNLPGRFRGRYEPPGKFKGPMPMIERPPGVSTKIRQVIKEYNTKRPTFANPMARGMRSHPNKLGRPFGGTLLKGPIP